MSSVMPVLYATQHRCSPNEQGVSTSQHRTCLTRGLTSSVSDVTGLLQQESTLFVNGGCFLKVSSAQMIPSTVVPTLRNLNA